jgi:hypothetical protein
MPTISANTANPVFIRVSIFHQTMVEELGGVGGSNVKGYESKFSQNSHQYIPAQSLCFLTHYTATKNSFTLLEIVTGQEKIYGPSVQVGLTNFRAKTKKNIWRFFPRAFFLGQSEKRKNLLPLNICWLCLFNAVSV